MTAEALIDSRGVGAPHSCYAVGREERCGRRMTSL
jgi:hypothetical protein